MLRHRLLTAAIVVPVELTVIYLGSWPLTVFVVLVLLFGLREFYRLAPGRQSEGPAGGVRVPGWICWFGYLVAVCAPAIALVRAETPFAGLLIISALLGTVAAALLALQRRCSASPSGGAAPASASVGLIGSLLLPGLLSYLIYLRYLQPHGTVGLAGISVPRGAVWLALVVAAGWTTDTAAYAVGTTLGAHKLWPSVSPGKTIEGSIGGLLGTAVLTLLLGHWLGLPARHALGLGCALGVLGQLGDLAESKLKRSAGVKDSGSILPGHGGVLDHFDSLLVTGPLAYYYLRFLVGIQ